MWNTTYICSINNKQVGTQADGSSMISKARATFVELKNIWNKVITTMVIRPLNDPT